MKRAMRVWAAAQRAPGSARPFQGVRLEALWASKSPKATATAKSKILTPRLLGCARGLKGRGSAQRDAAVANRRFAPPYPADGEAV